MLDLWIQLLLFGLLLLSALFSATETAVFSLASSGREQLSGAARRLVDQPRKLLVTLLLADLVVNLLFFAFTQRLHTTDSLAEGVLLGLASLAAVFVFGDFLPKVLALRVPVLVARAGAPLMLALVRVFEPVQRLVTAALEATCRALGSLARDERALTPEDLAEVLEQGAEHGLLAEGEADLLAEIVELEDIRVREIMTPRVDALFLDLTATQEERARIVARAVELRLSWLPLVDGNPDQVRGRVRVRDLLVEAQRDPRELCAAVKFVPEVASCLDLLQSLREARAAEAVVVDEWGGTAGTVSIEAVFEEIVGDLRAEDEAPERLALPLGEGTWRVAGHFSIRDWNERFGFDVVPNEFETIGGFVTALLGRIPRAGDAVRHGELHLRVHEVRRRRVLWVDMRVESPQAVEA